MSELLPESSQINSEQSSLPVTGATPSQLPSKSHKLTTITTASLTGLVVALCVAGYLFYQNQQLKSQLELTEPESQITSRTCVYNGVEYQPGESINIDSCNSCSCTETGDVSCTAMACEEDEGTSDNTLSLNENRYTIGKYSFVVPKNFFVEDEYPTGEITSFVKITNHKVKFELTINEPGRGWQCYEQESDGVINVGGKNVELLQQRGIDNTEFCTDHNQVSKYLYWLILEKYTAPPQEGIKDLVLYSFNTDEISREEADNIFNQILSTFQIAD